MYKIRFADDAVRDIERLDRQTATRIVAKLQWLSENADLIKPKGLQSDLAGFNKLRVGDYRVIYEILLDNRP